MGNAQKQGIKAAQTAHTQGTQIDFNKMNAAARDAALAEQRRLQAQSAKK